jgi:hypothetical protein
MVRSLLKLSALIAPAAILFACSSSSTGTTGAGGTSTSTTGTGGKATTTTTTTGTGGATGACANSADEAALQTHQSTIGSDVSSCTLQNIVAGMAATASCIESMDGLSMACADCFATYGGCGAMKCLTACTGDGGSSAPGCESCLATSCEPAFQTCSGVSGTQPGDAGGGG